MISTVHSPSAVRYRIDDGAPLFAVREPARPIGKPRFLDTVRDALRTRHYSRRTAEAYVAWIRRYIVFSRKRHPAQMGAEWQLGVEGIRQPEGGPDTRVKAWR